MANRTLPYALTEAAVDDLREIARYTLRQWGKSQSLRYAALLERCFREIAVRSGFSKTVSERYPDLRVSRCEHHYVFYVHPPSERPRIIAVLHEKMELLDRLTGRLP